LIKPRLCKAGIAGHLHGPSGFENGVRHLKFAHSAYGLRAAMHKISALKLLTSNDIFITCPQYARLQISFERIAVEAIEVIWKLPERRGRWLFQRKVLLCGA
jgi:hypothetical protein